MVPAALVALPPSQAALVASGGVLARLLPPLYAQTVVREDLIRTVDLGPFKHKVCGWRDRPGIEHWIA